jgi:RNA-directed DNA polymerase
MNLSKKEIEVVKSQFDNIKSVDDLVVLLNEIRLLKYGEDSRSEVKTKITLAEINFYSNEYLDEEKLKKLYTTFEINKKSGGKRIISAPVYRLKFVLSCLDTLLRVIHVPHPRSFGFVDGRSIVNNASFHTNRNYVYNIDLKDFFHSFDKNRIKMALYNEPFNLKGERDVIAYKIACICTYNFNGRRVLPQGSPTSPIITNIICWRLDKRLQGLAKRFGAEFTRYADDITFSSNHNVYREEFIAELRRIISEENLWINPEKTRLQKNNVRQSVTGLTVNAGVNVANEFIKEVRMYLYYCERYGYQKAKFIFLKDFQNDDKGVIVLNPPELSEVLRGKLNYLSMVKGKENSTYLKFEERFNKLFPDSGTTYLQRIIAAWENNGIEKAINLYKDLESKGKNNQEATNEKYNYLRSSTEKNAVSEPEFNGEMQYFFKKYLNQDFPLESFMEMHGWQYTNEDSLKMAYDNYILEGNTKILHELRKKEEFAGFKPNNITDEDWYSFLMHLIKTEDDVLNLEFIEETIKAKLESYYDKSGLDG